MTITVVIIDDDSDDLDIMTGLIKEIDESILCVSFLYADEAVRILGKELMLVPDFFFIDINMPRVSGPDVMLKIRGIPEFQDSKIVMYSTTMDENMSRRLIEKGASVTMQKPGSISDYMAILKFLILGDRHQDIDLSNGHVRVRHRVKY